jgi:beta-lactamase superfamily II metal-dependent hydrolase
MATNVYVLNVGAGSCTVIHSPTGHLSMVDVNDGTDQRSYEPAASEQPLTDPIDWFRAKFGTDLFRFILSHPDGDHMAGLRRILRGELSVQNFWDLPHNRHRDDDDFRNEEARNDWLYYTAFRLGLDIDGLTWPKRISPLRGDQLDFWSQDHFEILSPTPQLVQEADAADSYNDASYVLRFRHTTSTVLVASDVEAKGWNDMIAAGVDLRANVLIASHHGRKSGFSEAAMQEIRPNAVIVSTAKLDAKDDAVPDYKRYTPHVYSTRIDGDTTIRMWDDGDLDIYDASGTRLGRWSDP